MPAPGSVNAGAFGQQAFDILLRFVLDKQTLADVQNGTTSVGQALDKFYLTQSDVAGATLQLSTALEEQEKKTAALQRGWWRAQRELRAAQFAMTALIAVGGAITAPLIATATTWASEMEKANAKGDQVYDRWRNAMTVIKGAELEVGRTTAEVLLPTLEKLAELADKGSKFVAEHPDIIKAALTTGAALLTIGTLGSILVQGIKLYVDVKFVSSSLMIQASAFLMEQASKRQLAAASIMASGGTWKGPLPTMDMGSGLKQVMEKLTGTIVPLATNIGALALPMAALVDLVAQMNGGRWRDLIYGPGQGEQHKTLDPFQNLKEMLAANLIGREEGLVKRGTITREQADDFEAGVKAFLRLGDAANDTSKDLMSAAEALRRAQADKEGFKIMEKLNDDLLKLAKKYAKDRLKVEDDFVNDLLKADQKLKDRMGEIDLNLGRKLADLAADFANTELKAREDEAFREQEIVRKGNDEIAKVKRDGQKKLAELEQEHKNRLWDLAIANDALGIAIENRKYAQDKARLEGETSEAVREKRREVQIQLAEQRRQFALEEMQRRRDYQKRIDEANLQALRDRQDAEANWQEERKQIGEDHVQKLQDLKDQYDEERRQRLLSAYEDIIALGDALSTERDFKKKYYDVMVADAEAFAEAYKAALDRIANQTNLPGAPYTPGYDMGGYTKPGLARVHAGEYVMSPPTVRAAEKIVGQQLTQQGLLAAMLGGGSGRVSLSYVDQRRFDSRLHPEDREQIRQDTYSILQELIG